MVLIGSGSKPNTIPCGCLLYAIFCPLMLTAVVLFAIGTMLLFTFSCGRFPCGDSDTGSVPRELLSLPSKGAAKSRFICDDDLNEITNLNRQYSGGSCV
jgi:hypothetical protein